MGRSIFGAFAVRGHFNQPGIELPDDFDEVLLGGHDGVDILVDHGDFVEAGRDESNAVVAKVSIDLFPIESLVGAGAAHNAAGTMGGRIESGLVTFATHDESRGGHGTGNNAKDASAGRSGAFAMDDDFTRLAVDGMGFPPGKVVMVLKIKHDLRAEILGNVLVDEGVIRGGVLAHQFHGGPVFLAFRFGEREPGEALQFTGKIGMYASGELAVVIADRSAGAAAAAVAEESEIFAGRKSVNRFLRFESAEFDEMIATATGAELGPGFVFVLSGDGTAGPIGIENRVLAAAFKTGADTETRLLLDGAGETILLAIEMIGREIEDGHFHAASDVDTDCIRNDGVFGSEHAADGEAVTDVRIRHERACDRNGEEAGILHLTNSVGLKAFAPLMIIDRLGAGRRRSIDDGFGEFFAERVLGEESGIGDDGFNLFAEAGFIASLEEIRGDKINGAAMRAARNTQ